MQLLRESKKKKKKKRKAYELTCLPGGMLLFSSKEYIKYVDVVLCYSY